MSPKFNPDDIEATAIFLRLVGDAARRNPDGSAPEVCELLLSADLRWLTEALAEMRASEWDHGYRQGHKDALSGTDGKYNLSPDAPTWDELQRSRGLEPNSDYATGYGPVKRPSDYPGGRWPGRPQTPAPKDENLNWTGNE